ncbi:MAG: ComF family protein [Candidatus Magasanikbacteria bacterium]|nr:ComF family protein [Candidatus Magasanikbacteria bacterium]
MLNRERVTHWLFDRLFPLFCFGCEKEGCWVCSACEDALLFLPPVWQEVSAPLRGSAAVFSYDQPVVRGIVTALKYRHAERVVPVMNDFIARWLSDGGRDIFPPDGILVPVPLHRRRYVERGFNQAELLAIALGHLLGQPVVRLLKRTRATLHQTRQTRLLRWQNVDGAFAVADDAVIDGRPVILVDDVTTTGATFAACARPLTAAGVQKIYGFAFAREL